MIEMTKEKLESYRALRKECEILEKQIFNKRQSLLSARIIYDDMPKGIGAKPEDEIISLADDIRDLERKKNDAEQAYKDIEQWIADLTDPRDRNIFRLKYLECLPFWRVALEVGYSETQTKRRCRKVLMNVS